MKPQEITTLIKEENLTEFARRFLQEFLKDGFGAASKRSTELHVFHLLEVLGGMEQIDNNQVSHKLQITETRVRSYRYESKLRFVPAEDKYIQRRILWALAKSEFDVDVKSIRFTVEDEYVRSALAGEAKRIGAVPDTSFNSEIVSLKVDQLKALVTHLYGAEIGASFEKELDALLKANSKLSFSEVRNKFVTGAASALGGGMVKGLKAWLTGNP